MNHTRTILTALGNINRALTTIELFMGDKLTDGEKVHLAEVIRDCYTATTNLQDEVVKAEEQVSMPSPV